LSSIEFLTANPA